MNKPRAKGLPNARILWEVTDAPAPQDTESTGLLISVLVSVVNLMNEDENTKVCLMEFSTMHQYLCMILNSVHHLPVLDTYFTTFHSIFCQQ